MMKIIIKSIIVILSFFYYEMQGQSVPIPEFIDVQPRWVKLVEQNIGDSITHKIGLDSRRVIHNGDYIINIVKDSSIYGDITDPDIITGESVRGNIFRSYDIESGDVNWSFDRVAPHDISKEELYYEPTIIGEKLVYAGIRLEEKSDSTNFLEDWRYDQYSKFLFTLLEIDINSGDLINIAYSQEDTITNILPHRLKPTFNSSQFLNIQGPTRYNENNHSSFYEVVPLATDMDIDSTAIQELEVSFDFDDFDTFLPLEPAPNRLGNYIIGRRYFEEDGNNPLISVGYILNIVDMTDLDQIEYKEIDITDYSYQPHPIYPQNGFLYEDNNIIVFSFNYEEGRIFWSHLWLTDDGTIKASFDDLSVDGYNYNIFSHISFRNDDAYLMASRRVDTTYYLDILKIDTDNNVEKVGSISSTDYISRHVGCAYDDESNSLIINAYPDDEYNVVMCFDGADIGIEPIVSKTEEVHGLSFDIYPNPTQGHLQISGIDHFDGVLTITDVSGKELRKMTIQFSGTYDVDLSELQGGAYVIQLQEKDEAFEAKKILHIK